jgi:cytochrome c oxidase assembly factor CtaG
MGQLIFIFTSFFHSLFQPKSNGPAYFFNPFLSFLLGCATLGPSSQSGTQTMPHMPVTLVMAVIFFLDIPTLPRNNLTAIGKL